MPKDVAKAYDEVAEAYARKSETSFYNAHYERPAIISLLPDIRGKRVLDAGCGGGSLTNVLLKRGAHVIGMDISTGLVNIARQRFGDRATFHMADLAAPLYFIDDQTIDVVVSSLVLHYIKDWQPVFDEFQRVLTPGGTVVFSTHHPHMDWRWFDRENYFQKERYTDTWDVDGHPMVIKYYHRTLTEMFDIFATSDFYVDKLLEPQPHPDVESLAPETYHKLCHLPHFLFFRLKQRT